MGGAALRMAEGGACSAMAAWHEVTVLRRRQARALKHWTERQLVSAYNRWTEHVHETRRQRQLLGKALGRMAQRQLARAFDAWMESVEETRADAARQQHVASGVALRMAERGVCSAMATWHGVAVLRRKQARALKHWTERQLAAAYGRWAEHAQEAKVQRQRLSKALGRLAHRQLSGAYLRWAEHVAEAQWQRHHNKDVVVRRSRVGTGMTPTTWLCTPPRRGTRSSRW